jgi:hypothetical protein
VRIFGCFRTFGGPTVAPRSPRGCCGPLLSIKPYARAVSDFEVGEHVVLKEGLPQRADHVGTVVKIEKNEIWVRWSGPDAPPEPAKFSARALERV